MSIPSANVAPTEENADCLRLLSLVIDYGSVVLLHQFDKRIPPVDLSNKLNETDVRIKLSEFRQKKVLNENQWKCLYPQIGISSSEHFDLTLLTLLLRYICGLDEKSPAWNRKPSPTDVSVEADVARLRTMRNKISHMKKLSLTQHEFQTIWDKAEQVILRLGRDIPNLSVDIRKLKHGSIDPSKERAYQEKLKEYKEMEHNFKSDIETVKSEVQLVQFEVKQQREHLESLFIKQDKLEEQTRCQDKKLEDITTMHSNLEQSLQRTKQACENDISNVSYRLQKTDSKVDEIHITPSSHVKQGNDAYITRNHLKQKQPTHTAESREEKRAEGAGDREFERLVSRTKLYLDERHNVFTSTNAHKKAKDALEKNGWVILTGQPGEGKTTMALELLRKMQPFHTCVKLNEPKDWKNVDFDKDPSVVIFIDDIFGGGALSDRLLSKWSCYLPDMYKAVQKKKLQAIITTRHYILQEARDHMQRLHLFKDENIIYISSHDLTQEEKTEMIAVHLKNGDREIAPGLIDDCVSAYDQSFKRLNWDYNLHNHVFPGGALSEYLRIGKFEEFKSTTGFPEVVSLFVEHDHLFMLGSEFFSKPLLFFKRCIEDLYLDPEKYLALLLVWTMPKQELRLIDLDPPIASFELKETALKFGFELTGQIRRALRRSLEYHKGGFLVFEPERGVYKFCHNIVKDMVGLVGAKECPKAFIEYASIDFLLQYVTIDRRKSQDGFHVFIEEYRYEQLINVFWNILISDERTDPFENLLDENHFEKHLFGLLFSLERGSLTNVSILKHECFNNEQFVHLFLENENGIAFSRSQGFFSESFGYYGLGLPNLISVYAPSLTLLYGNQMILRYYLENMIPRGAKLSDDFYYINTLLAIHKGLLPSVELLLRHGSSVNEDAIYIAARRGDVSILRFLLMNKRKNYEPKTNVFNGNNPLIAAAKSGSEDCIKALLKDGSDVNYKNTNGWTALDKGILYGKTDVCKILLQNGASVNNKIGKFHRAPLHRCADLGHTEIAALLLQYGASVNVRDKKGYFPVHCAAFSGHYAVVDLLLKADCCSAKQLKYRLSYGKKSVLSGADLYHVAVYKNRLNVITVLLQNKLNPNVRDFYGRTPFYRAVYEEKLEVFCLVLQLCDRKIAEKCGLPAFDINMADNHGYTPLHAAIHKRNRFFAEHICPYANVNAQDKHGKTPLHTACENLNLHLFKVLIKDFRADVRMVTKQGLCIFDILDNKSRNRNFYDIWKRNRTGKLHKIVHKEPRWIDFLNVVKTVDEEFANNWKDLIKQSAINKN